jgi:hypothetical protein
LQHVGIGAQEGGAVGRAGHQQRQALGGRHAHLAAQGAAGVHHLLDARHVGDGGFVDLLGLCFGVAATAMEAPARPATGPPSATALR